MRGRFDEPAGETSVLVNQSQINGGLNFVEVHPWGHDYVYHCPGQHGTNRFEVYSSGPDGLSKSGGEDADDFASWPKPGVHE